MIFVSHFLTATFNFTPTQEAAMFRRLRAQDGKSPANRETSPKSGTSGLPLGEGAIWYKPPPASPSTNNNSGVVPPPPSRGRPADAQQRQQQSSTGTSSDDNHRRLSSPHEQHAPLHTPLTIPFSSDHFINTTPTPHPHHNISREQHASNQHPLPQSPTNRTKTSPSTGPRSDRRRTTASNSLTVKLIHHVLKGNEWGPATQCIEQDPSCARFKEPMTLLSLSTVAYPLHAAIVMNPPMVFLEKLCGAFPMAAQMADETFGRMPLHWACMAGNSSQCLEKLIQLYPTGPRVMDKAQGRIPLHYMVVFATDIGQVTTIFDSEPRGVKTKDKRFKTPIDLAQSTTNPLKLDILAELLRKNKRNNKKQDGTISPKTTDTTSWDQRQHDPITQETLAASSATPSTEFRNYSETAKNIAKAEEQVTASSLENHPRIVIDKPPMSGGFLFHRSRQTRNEIEPTAVVGGIWEVSGKTTTAYRNHPASVNHQVSAAAAAASDGRAHGTVSAGKKKPPPDSAPPRPAQQSHDQIVAVASDGRAHAAMAAGRKKPPPGSIPQQHSPGVYQVRNDEEYMRNYANKMQRYSGNDYHLAGGTGRELMIEMNGNINTLKDQISDYGQALRLKDIQLTEVTGKLDAMNSAERELTEELMQAQRAKEESNILLRQKQSHASKIRRQIAELEEMLAEEESTIQTISRSIISYSKSAGRVEATLKNYHTEHGNLTTARGALEEEKLAIDKNMNNCEAELKSLEAIQRMATGHGEMGP